MSVKSITREEAEKIAKNLIPFTEKRNPLAKTSNNEQQKPETPKPEPQKPEQRNKTDNEQQKSEQTNIIKKNQEIINRNSRIAIKPVAKSSITLPIGRLGNQIIRNLAVSIIAEKFNLHVIYCQDGLINKLGIPLFVGTNKYINTYQLNDDNYFSILNRIEHASNVNPNRAFFQTNEITNLIFKYLRKTDNNINIRKKNPYEERYKNNKDLFIHIRLTDAVNANPGLNYYLNTIKKIRHDKMFIATDEVTHSTIKEIINLYPSATILDYDEINTIQFGSTCKNIILSNGSFSAVIGYLAFYSTVYYPTYPRKKEWWHGDMFSNKGWIECNL